MRTIKQNPSVSFGTALRKARKEAGLTQIELAKASGLSHMSIRRYETDDRFPELDSFLALSDALPTDPDIVMVWIESHMEQICSMIPDDKTYKAIEYALDLGNRVTRHNCIQKIEKADPAYLACVAKIFESLETMTEEGRRKAQESVEMISKIPDYQAISTIKRQGNTADPYSEDDAGETAHDVDI